jgi:hypothetical protein
MAENNSRVRAWLFGLLSDLENGTVKDATFTESGKKDTIVIEWEVK